MVALITIFLLAGFAQAYSCVNFTVQATVNATNHQPNFAPFKSHYDSVALLLNLTARDASTVYPGPLGSPIQIHETFTIAASYCIPTGGSNGHLQVLTHGIGFDRDYWSFGGPGSEYNYIQAATDSGYSTVSYDRIGTGNSTHPDPYTVCQSPAEVGVLEVFTTLIRNGSVPQIRKPTGKVFHLGHSFGSLITNGFVAARPDLSDGVVLTDFSNNGSFTNQNLIASNLHLAKENSLRFQNLSAGYLTWGDELANQFGFFRYPYFNTSVLATAEATKQPFTISEMLSAGPPYAPNTNATTFAKPVLALAGHYDNIFCGDNCNGILEQTRTKFPVAAPFKTYQQPNAGHAVFLHYNATGAFEVILDFLKTCT